MKSHMHNYGITNVSRSQAEFVFEQLNIDYWACNSFVDSGDLIVC